MTRLAFRTLAHLTRTCLKPGLALAALAGVMSLFSAAPAQAVERPFDPVPVIADWLLPRYDTLQHKAVAQKEAWTRFCATPAAEGVPALQTAYGETADAWNAVEFITFGPISQELRADRFSFFPDRRNAIARAVANLISDQSDNRLSPEHFAQTSAAGQGLPALERLLYEGDATEALVSGKDAPQRCALGVAIATNLAIMATDVRTSWGDRNSGAFGAIVSGKGDPAMFPDTNALGGMLLTDLSGAYQRVTDTKLLPVLGGGPDVARPKLADSWRSGRSGRVVANIITSADDLLRTIAKQMPSRPQWVVERAAKASDAAANKLPADIGAAAESANGAAVLHDAIRAFKATQLTVYRPMASYFGISLGFNALDGD
ncbi:imelysin family protein [Xanthobacter sp. TB0139]|uniref:imelysin family protein n=1 Tax=Xanthobacter sp. TB0139 TaxID=3459178 RepID=UPI00403959F9